MTDAIKGWPYTGVLNLGQGFRIAMRDMGIQGNQHLGNLSPDIW
jgi:hypothetical protein